MEIKSLAPQKLSRREWLASLAYWACASALALVTIGLIRFPKPALLPMPSRVFKIGKPEDFPIGAKRIYEEEKVMVRRETSGICAISLVCTHLGCTVYQPDEKFLCPCHGSKFDQQGRVIFGPAPRHLDWFEIHPLPDGTLVVDASKKVPLGKMYVV